MIIVLYDINPSLAEITGQVGGDERGGMVVVCVYIAGEAVDVNAEDGGSCRRIALGQQGQQQTGQHVSGTGSSHTLIACGVVELMTIGHADEGMMTFQDKDDVVSLGERFGFFGPVEAVG